MKNLWMSLLGIISAVLMSGCGAPVSTGVLDSDWCYLFDFTQNQQGFLITTGTMTAQGLSTDITGLLQTSYGYTRDVYPSVVDVVAVRPTGVTGAIDVTAAGVVFGVSTYFSEVMPSEIDIANLRFTPATNREEFIGDRSAINITIDASQPLTIESIYVGGMGASPFATNLCDDSTPTPVVEIVTATGTTAPSTPSPSPTVTGTLSATPTPSTWECFWDFAVSDHGWDDTPYFAAGHARGADGWESSNQSGYDGIAIQRYFTAGHTNVTVTDVEIDYDITGIPAANGNNNLVIILSSIYNVNSATNPPEPFTWSGSETFERLYIGFWNHATGDMTMRSVYIAGTGPSPDDCTPPDTSTPTPTISPTPGPTNTPGPTATPEPLWTACLDFTVNNFSFEGVDATYEDDLGWIQDAGEWSIGRAGLGPSAKKTIKFTFSGAWAGSIRLTDLVGVDETGWHLASGSSFVADFSDEDWVPRQNMRIEFDGNYGPYILEELCWVDIVPLAPTVIPGGGTLTRTPLPTVTGTVAPSRTPILVPAPVILITAATGVYITTTPIYSGTGVYSPSGTPSLLITGTPGEEGTPGGDGSNGTGYGSGGGGFGDVGEILGFGWNIGWGLFGALVAYLGQAGGIVTALVTAFANATPQPIPGLPMCVTNPMASDLCAIYYVADYTIFAQNTPGALIIPLLLIIMNIWIAIYFVRWVLRIIRRGEAVTDAP